MAYSTISMLLIIFGWATALSSLLISLIRSYPSYKRFNPNDYVFYRPEDLKNQSADIGYVIKNETILNETNLEKCTLVSMKAFENIVSFVDNDIVLIAYFSSISLMILSEIAATFFFIKKLRPGNSDSKNIKIFKWVLFVIKTNFIVGTFAIAIIDYSLDCFQLNVPEFYIEVAYYSIIVFVISLSVGIFVVLFVVFLISYIFSVACGSVFCDCNIKQSTDCFAGPKFLIFLCILILIVVLLELTNIVIYVILFFGPTIAKIINTLMTINLAKDIAQIFFCCK